MAIQNAYQLGNCQKLIIYRATRLDLFDRYQITKMKFAHDIFRKCAIIDGLTHENPRMHKINAELIAHIPIDSSLRNLLHAEKRPQYDIAKKTREAKEFTESHLISMTSNETKAIDQFYDEKIFNRP